MNYATSSAAVFLDRDGVLAIPEFRDGRSFAVRQLEDFKLYPDAAESARALKHAGFVVIVITNQPDVGAGKTPRETVEAMHTLLRDAVAIDDIEVSYDTGAAPARRRKPSPGMLLDAAARWKIDLSRSYMVGDRPSDVEAGVRAGCTTVFIDRGYTAEASPTLQAVTVKSLAEATAWILAASKTSTSAPLPARPTPSEGARP